MNLAPASGQPNRYWPETAGGGQRLRGAGGLEIKTPLAWTARR